MFMHQTIVESIAFKEKYRKKIVISYKKRNKTDCVLINKEQYR